MTKEEALFESMNCGDIDYAVCRFDLSRLRALGYVVVAVKPDEAEIEAIAQAIEDAEGLWGCAHCARAAMITYNEGKP